MKKDHFFPLRLAILLLQHRFFFFIKSHIKTDTHWKLLWWHQKFILRTKRKGEEKKVERKKTLFLSKFRRKFFSFSFHALVYLFFSFPTFGFAQLRYPCFKRSINECSSDGGKLKTSSCSSQEPFPLTIFLRHSFRFESSSFGTLWPKKIRDWMSLRWKKRERKCQ